MTLRCRRNVASLSPGEKRAFRDAVYRLREQGRYQPYVGFHGFVSNLGHEGPAFFPWHRTMLKRFEDDLISVNPALTLPYWDFTSSNLDGAGNSQIWNNDLFGGNGTVTLTWTGLDGAQKSWTIRRRSFDVTAAPVTPASVNNALNEPTYQPSGGSVGFRERAEFGHHGGAHVWLGIPGDQSSFATAVNDPFFLLLHCNIDRIWSLWQQRRKEAWLAANPGLPYPANLPAVDYFYDGLTPATTWTVPPNRHNLDNAMWPWDGTEAQPGNPASSFPPWNAGMPETYTPRATLRSFAFGGYLYNTDKPLVDLRTPSVTFPAIAEGHTTVAAAVFGVRSCASAATFQVAPTGGPGAGFGLPFGASAVFDPALGSDEGEARIWISYTGTTAGAMASTTVTIRCLETTESWTIPVSALTVAKPKVAAALVLDRSGSMAENAGLGDSQQRMDVLKQAAPVFVGLLEETDGIGVASFSGDATADMAAQPAGIEVFGPGRLNARAAISALSPGGTTSIGDGAQVGHAIVDPLIGYDSKALVVLTDGYENTPQYIADVAAVIGARVFAIGVGTADYLNPAALDALTSGTGGFLTMTGTPAVDDLRLSKYFLQILAGVTNADIVEDPEGRLHPGEEHRYPFLLTDADVGADVIVLLPARDLVDVALESPSGVVFKPDGGGAIGATYVVDDRVSYWRLRLPVASNGMVDRAGTWQAILTIDDASFKEHVAALRDNPTKLRDILAHGVPYTLAVHAKSDLRLTARLTQRSREPGAEAHLVAQLTEFGLPLRGRTAVAVEITDPNGAPDRARLDRVGEGRFEAVYPLAVPGTYRFRLLARGLSHSGQPFTREHSFTASVWRGGDRPLPQGDEPLPAPEGEKAADDAPGDRGRRPPMVVNIMDPRLLARLMADVSASPSGPGRPEPMVSTVLRLIGADDRDPPDP